MATTILNKTKSTYGNPHAYYKVEVTGTSNRTANSVKVSLKITSNLSVSYASLGTGYTLKGYLYAGSGWSSAIAIKESSAKWSGTTEHVKNATVTISGLNSTQTKLTGVKFKVNSNASDKACQLNETSCSNITIPSYHRNPEFTPNNVTLTEVNQAVINANLPDYTFALNLSIIRIDVSNVVYYDGADFARLELLEEKYAEVWEKVAQVTTNPGYYTPTKAFAWDDLWVRLYDTKGGSAFDENTTFVFHTIPYIKVTMDASTKRVGQTSGQVSISCEGKYYNGDVGNVPQGGTYKPVVKYKFWRYGTTEPQTYAYTVNPSNVTISDGTYRVSGLNIGSTDEHASNYFNPKFAYRVKIQVNDNFTTQTSGDMSIPVGEPVWTEYKDRVDFKKLTIQGVEVTPGGGTGGDYDNLINKPSINSVTLSGDKTPAQLGFSAVATSGSYNDLTNKPTINNGTLTIQKNGTNVQTFSANQSGNATANITVPTKTSEITNDSGYISSSQSTVGSTDRPVYLNNGTPTQTNTPASGNYFRGVPFVTSGGVMEIGRYIDFHPTNDSTLDFSKRLDAGAGTTARTLTLPDKTGTIAITSDIPTNTNQLTNGAGFITSSGSTSGNAGSATKLQNARTISIGTGATGTATSFDGTSNITIPVTNIKDGYITWGGKNLVDNVSPNDMGSIDEFGHNKLAYLPAGCIKVEYTNDGGTTWLDYGFTDAQKIAMVTTTGANITIGKGSVDATQGTLTTANMGNYKVRVTISTRNGSGQTSGVLYTQACKWLINMTTNGATCRCLVENRTIGNYNTSTNTWATAGDFSLGGWSGWNSLPLNYRFGGSNTQTGQIADTRFTLYLTGINTSNSCKAALIDFRLIGFNNWAMPSELARAGRLYEIDTTQTAIFPHDVRPKSNNSKSLGNSSYKWKNVYATTFNGALNGTASFTGNVNFNKNEAQNFAVQRLSTAPASPVNGQLYYDTNYGTVYVYANGGWVDVLATTEPTENYNQLFNRPITNLEGTSTEPLILANLSHGTYRVMGEYKYDSSDTLKSTDGALILVFGQDSETKRIIFGEGGVIIGNGTIENGKFKSLLPIVTTSSMTANSTIINGWKTELIDGVLVEYYGG